MVEGLSCLETCWHTSVMLLPILRDMFGLEAKCLVFRSHDLLETWMGILDHVCTLANHLHMYVAKNVKCLFEDQNEKNNAFWLENSQTSVCHLVVMFDCFVVLSWELLTQKHFRSEVCAWGMCMCASKWAWKMCWTSLDTSLASTCLIDCLFVPLAREGRSNYTIADTWNQ